MKREWNARWEQAISRVPTYGWIVGGSILSLVLILLLVRYSLATGATLWDWLNFLIVPAVIAGGGIWFNRQQKERELHIADQRAQDDALKAYLDQMSQLLGNKNRTSGEAQASHTSTSMMARAQTLTLLMRLKDGGRKGSVLRFLYEAGLLTVEDKPDFSLALPRPFLNLNRVDLNQIVLKGDNFNWVDLSRADLSGANLRGAKLEAVKLPRANLSRANLNRATLLGVDLEEANLSEVDLSEVRLLPIDIGTGLRTIYRSTASGSEVSVNMRIANDTGSSGSVIPIQVSTNLNHANLRGANLNFAELPEAPLEQADLRNASLVETNLNGARLVRACLQDSDLRFAQLHRTDLSSASLTSADLRNTSVRDSGMQNADLSGAWLDKADLRGADLNKASLRATSLTGTNLQGANVKGANVKGADLEGVNLEGANLQGANLRGADLLDANLQRANLQRAKELTQKQLEEPIGDEATQLPEGFHPPAFWIQGEDNQTDGKE